MSTEPMFREPLHVGRPNVAGLDRFQRRLDDALDRRYLSNGPLVREFEERLAETAGVRHCVATCNATVGIQIAMKSCGVMPGDEVIVPTYTWIGSAHALAWVGIVPVFCDVDLETATMDPGHAERLIGPRTKAIMGVHVYGHPCHIDPLTDLADRHGLALLFDSAHAIGSAYHGRPIGSFGRAEIFSFHASKIINSFEGGAIVTDDADLAARARAMRNFGVDDQHEIVSEGTNGKMCEPVAAMGLTSLEELEHLVEVHVNNFRHYGEGLAGLPGITLRTMPEGERTNHQYVVIEVDEAAAGISRDGLLKTLSNENVLARRYFHPCCHVAEPYRGAPEVHSPLPMPNSERLAERVLSLPSGLAVGAQEISGVCEIIRRTVS